MTIDGLSGMAAVVVGATAPAPLAGSTVLHRFPPCTHFYGPLESASLTQTRHCRADHPVAVYMINGGRFNIWASSFLVDPLVRVTADLASCAELLKGLVDLRSPTQFPEVFGSIAES